LNISCFIRPWECFQFGGTIPEEKEEEVEVSERIQVEEKEDEKGRKSSPRV